MIKKFKQWLINYFLPMWAKETVLTDNRQLLAKVAELEQKLEKKDAYISGLEDGIRAQRRIIINAGGGVVRNEQQNTD